MLIMLTVALVLSVAAILWPWIRQKETREKAIVAALVMVLLSAALYLHLGAPFAAQHIAAQQVQNATTVARMQALQDASTSRNLSATEWAELGAAYMEAERYAESAEALRRAVTESGGDADLIMAYGKALMLAEEGTVTQEAARAFEMAATLMPENPEPEFLLAVGAMQSGDKEAAQTRFARLYDMLPPQAPLRSIIRARLDALATQENESIRE